MILKFIILVFVVFRLSSIFAYERGPFNIFGSFRIWLGRKANDNKFMYELSEMIHCPHCSGIWFTILIVPFLDIQNLVYGIIWVFGIAGAQSFLISLLGFDREE